MDLRQDTLFGKRTIMSIGYDEQQIIRDILNLHCDGQPVDCDPTYSVGNFYKDGIPKPPHRFDVDPEITDVIHASADNLPLEDESVGVLMFDPPFICGLPVNAEPGLMKKRFGYFKNVDELWTFYGLSLREFMRVLKPGGILIFKCQDTVDSGKNRFSHCAVYEKALELGFKPKDLFVLLAKNRIIDVEPENQQHARKFHSYFWVFQKPTKRKQ